MPAVEAETRGKKITQRYKTDKSNIAQNKGVKVEDHAN